MSGSGSQHAALCGEHAGFGGQYRIQEPENVL
jgi:hypothetical protein